MNGVKNELGRKSAGMVEREAGEKRNGAYPPGDLSHHSRYL